MEGKAAVVYGLVSKSGDIVYVGQSCKPLSRLKHHRKKHGQEIDMAILQQSFENESAREAEEKWIKKFSAGGAELTNIVHAQGDRKPVMGSPSRKPTVSTVG
jgi:predicted GIY-YIG superfamily endonuclease